MLSTYLKNIAYLTPCTTGLKNKLKENNHSINDVFKSLLNALINDTLKEDEINNLAPFCRNLFSSCSKSESEKWQNVFIELWDYQDKEMILSFIFHTQKGDEIFNSLSDKERVLYCGPWIRPMINMSSDESENRFFELGSRSLKQLFQVTNKEAQELLYFKMIDLLNKRNKPYTKLLSSLLELESFKAIHKKNVN